MSAGWLAILCLLTAFALDLYLILISIGFFEKRERRLFEKSLEEYTTNLRKLYSEDDKDIEEEIIVHIEGLENFEELKRKNKLLKKALKNYNL